ncbi:MAG: diacylglycerol kinase family protein [Bacillota bacterium]
MYIPRFRTVYQSFAYAWAGLVHAYATQRNLRFHFLAAYTATAAGVVLSVSAYELYALIFASAMVLVTEMVNTSIEVCVDLAAQGYHPLARTAKNVAAAAVLFTSIVALGLGAAIFLPRLDMIPDALMELFGAKPALGILLSGIWLVLGYTALFPFGQSIWR